MLANPTAAPSPRLEPAFTPGENTVCTDPFAEKATFPIRGSCLQPAGTPQEVHIPGYEVQGELGRGGMGVIFKAVHQELGRPVALKLLQAGGPPEHVGRFQAEAEALTRLRHPNIVEIYEVGTHRGVPFLCLELVEGGSLDRRLAEEPLPPREAAALLETLARAVHAAHEQGILHRDLKPGNILLTRDGMPKVIDFGLAKRLEVEEDRTGAGIIVGTPRYMAPEQVRGDRQALGPATDVYALGVILYEILAGRTPFDINNLVDLAHTTARVPVPPSHWGRRLPADLETICLKCLQKEPGRRYARAADLAEDLRRFQEGRRIWARRASPAERAWQWCRRNPLVTGLAAAVVLTLTGTLYLHADARRLRQDLDECRGQLGADQLAQTKYRAVLSRLLLEQERCAEAIALERQTLQECPAADRAERARSQTRLGRALFETGRFVEAEPLLREAWATLSADRPDAWTEHLLGACLSSLGKYAEAEPLLRESFQALAAAKDESPMRIRQARERLVELYEAWGKPEQADAWRP
jgi:tetratricopeptide (TPR) repeat protein/predicted Ser/Thr protein kinase